jgi:hypothetical protein
MILNDKGETRIRGYLYLLDRALRTFLPREVVDDAVGAGFVVLAALKPIFPNNVGLIMRHGWPIGFGAQFYLPPDAQVLGGYWIVPVSLAVGLGILIATHRGARAFVAWMSRRRETWRLRPDATGDQP